MAHKKALVHRKCNAKVGAARCSYTWGNHPRDTEGKVTDHA